MRVARLLLEAKADADCTNARGMTPLMTAVSYCTTPPEFVEALLAAGADPLRRSATKRSVTDYVNEGGNAAVAAVVARSVAAAEARGVLPRGGGELCALCGEEVRLGRLRLMSGKVHSGEERNAHVRAFVAHPCFERMLTDPLYHRAVANRQLTKEVSETWAVILAVRRVMAELGLGAEGQWPTFIDLCAGKSLTAALLAEVFPGARVIAVDRVSEQIASHQKAPSMYLQADIMADGFVELLAGEVGPGPAVLCGMHLCGALSPQAVSIFAAIPAIRAVVLSPCCLPAKKNSTVVADSGTKDAMGQYLYWGRQLGAYVELFAAADSVAVVQDAAIKSERNVVVTAVKAEGVGVAVPQPAGTRVQELMESMALPLQRASARRVAHIAQQGTALERRAARKAQRRAERE